MCFAQVLTPVSVLSLAVMGKSVSNTCFYDKSAIVLVTLNW